MTEEDQKAIAKEAVMELFAQFGIEDPKEFAKDIQHVRRWRVATEKAGDITFKLMVATIFSGFLGALWLGIQAIFKT